MIVSKNKKLDKESYIREEKAIFNGSEPEKLKIIHTLVCFTNYKGGEIVIDEVKNEQDFKTFFDAASIENAINSYIEPPIKGLIAVKQINKNKGVSIKINLSPRSPHFYKIDGCFINSKDKKIFIFQRGSIGIRRSGGNDIYNSLDFEQMFKKKITDLFGSIQDIVVKQPMGELMGTFNKIKGISTELVSYVHKPSDPSAIPIRQILDTEPFASLEEELNASVKSWKTSEMTLNEILIAKSYANFKKIKNKEHIMLLLSSSIEKRLPAYLWASKIKKSELKILLRDIIKKDCYPSINEVIKLVSMLPYKFAKEMFKLAEASRLISVRRLVEKVFLKIDLKNKNRKEAVRQYIFNAGTYNNIIQPNVAEIVNKFINAKKEEKSKLKQAWKIYDLEVFGDKLLK